MSDLGPLEEVLRDLRTALEELDVGWFLLGALAAQVHGAVRSTSDVDVSVRLGACSTQSLLEGVRARGFSPLFEDAQFIEATRVVPVRHSNGILVDVTLAGPGLEDLFLARALPATVASVEVPVATAEDLLIMKSLAGREKDRADCIMLLRAGGGRLDLSHVRSTLEQLEEALGVSDLLPLWDQLVAEAGAE